MAAQESKGTAGAGIGAALVSRWSAVIAAVVILAGLAGGFFLGAISEHRVAEIVAIAFGLMLAGVTLKAAFEERNQLVRAAALVYTAAFLFVGVYPAVMMLAPGRPDVEGQLDETAKTLALPGGGAYFVTVSGALHTGGAARATYKLSAGGASYEGVLERVYSYRRARRGAAVQIAADHDLAMHDIRVPDGDAKIALTTMSGDLAQKSLTVKAYRTVPAWVLWALAALAVALAGFLEARTAARGAVAMAGLTGVAFGFIIRTSDPGAVMGAVFSGALLSAGVGAIVGSAVGSLGRKLLGGTGRREREPQEPKSRRVA